MLRLDSPASDMDEAPLAFISNDTCWSQTNYKVTVTSMLGYCYVVVDGCDMLGAEARSGHYHVLLASNDPERIYQPMVSINRS